MKALVFLEVGKVGIVEKPIPDPGPSDAVVKTTASLICTSDVHTVRGVIEIPSGRGLGHEARQCGLQHQRRGNGHQVQRQLHGCSLTSAE